MMPSGADETIPVAALASGREAVQASIAKKSQRYRELDALRGLAALSVVLFHYTVRYFELFAGAPPLIQFDQGALGVEVFFGISGFVILMTLERSRTAGDFLVSRFSRLYPAYWTCLALTYAAMAFWPLPGREVAPLDALVDITMWQEVLGFRHVDGVYWSLQVELIFYALMLAIYLAGWLRHVRVLLALWLVVALITMLGAQLLSRSVPYIAERYLLLQYSAFFAIGGSAYLAFMQQRIGMDNCVLFLLAIAVAFAYHGRAGLVVSVGMVGLFILIARRKAAFLDQPVLVFLGTISYSWYLLHQNIGYDVIRAVQGEGYRTEVAIAAAIAATMLMATFVTYAVEQPALKWIRRRVRDN